MCIRENQKGESAMGYVCVRKERLINVNVSVAVKQAPELAAEACRKLGTPRNGFLKEGTASQGFPGE